MMLAGCGGNDLGPQAEKPEKSANAKPATRAWPKLPHCPSQAANCSSVRGTIIYIEANDPDGDGDAHFVLTSSSSLSGPGIAVIDVERELRPHPLPGVGARVAAAGPVYRGSYGQKQIQATTLRVGRG
jgi:hypothetical protein